MGKNSSFPGFPLPENNYFQLPRIWTDITRSMTSLAEMKVVEYVLRHTWGFQNWPVKKPRRISLDDFQNGRKGANGKRFDLGIGMGKVAVIRGIRLAVKHGFLKVVLDDRDKGRITKYYVLRLADHTPQGPSIETILPQYRNDTSYIDKQPSLTEGSLLDPNGSNGKCGDSIPESGVDTRKKRSILTKFDTKAAQKLQDIVSTHIKVNCKANMKDWAHEFRKMREVDEVSMDTIWETLDWYKDHVGEEFCPQAFSAKAFREKYRNGQFPSAMQREVKRADRTNGDGREKAPWEIKGSKEWLTQKIRSRWAKLEHHPDEHPPQKYVDKILVELGSKPGAVASTHI